MALLAAALLLRRARTGQGGHADVAQVEVIVGQLGDLLAAESLVPGSVRPRGNQGPDAPWGVFRCADVDLEAQGGTATEDWVAVSVRDDADWGRLVGVVAGDGLEAPAGVTTTADRLARRTELEEWLGRWTLPQTADAAAARLQAAGVPAARLLHPRTIVADEHERARDFVVALDQPGVGPMKFERPPWRGPDLGDFVETPAPWPGQHSRAVCRDWLGIDDGEIAGLLGAGIVEEYTGTG
jgi:crotonobetainyl-CoA:carnitine CoA-transferase CaiB-like acyl-CoA transferase